VDRRLLELRPGRFGIRYLGTLPEDMALEMTPGLIGRNPLPLSVGRLKKQPSPE